MAEEKNEEQLVKSGEEKVPTEEEKKFEPETSLWKPRTVLGQDVLSGKITDIEEILKSGRKILETEIVDQLVPALKSEIIMIGGRAGKGGGKQRIPIKRTATMHRSGRRFRTSSVVAVGNEDGLVGIGRASALDARGAIEKATQKAKLNLIRIKRGCGSWECGCEAGEHSIPFKTNGKSGSVKVEMMPAPKGIGLVADDESKKVLRLAGIKDIWIKTYGNTGMRTNLISAIFDGLKRLYVYEKA